MIAAASVIRWDVALWSVLGRLPDVADTPGAQDANCQADIAPRYAHLFQVGYSVNGFHPVGGNQARLMPDSNASIDAMVADIDAASEHVHLMFYIWLPDNNGLKMVEALKRAADPDQVMAPGTQCSVRRSSGSESTIPSRSGTTRSFNSRDGCGRPPSLRSVMYRCRSSGS